MNICRPLFYFGLTFHVLFNCIVVGVSLPLLFPAGNIFVNVNSSLTLTCEYKGLAQPEDYFIISWLKGGLTQGNVNSNCTRITGQFNLTCPDLNRQSITINRVDVALHETTWRCEFLIPVVKSYKSPNATINVYDCPISETLAGYEHETTYMLFHVHLPSQGLTAYKIRNIETNKSYLNIAYQDGAILGSQTSDDVDYIGDLATGNMSIRIPSMNSTFVGLYVLKKTSPFTLKNMKCVILSMRAKPHTPEISNKGRPLTPRGTMDQPLTLISAGGFPKPNLRWFRNNTETDSLNSNQTYTINDDGNYIVVQTYTFTPTRHDDMVSYYCQSFFDYAQPSYQRDKVTLYLNLKPLSSITTYTIEEGILGKAVICTASQYRPSNAQVWLKINGANRTEVPDVEVTHNVTTETYTMVALFNMVLTRQSNGQTVSCHIAHDTLQTPLIETSTISVNYAPDVKVTTSNVTVFDTAILTCTPSGLPAVYTYSNWRHTWPGHGTVADNKTLGNNQTIRLTALTYEHSGVYHCHASNGVTGSLNHNAGYGAAFLEVGTFPIILTPNPVQIFTSIQTDIGVLIQFYSNRLNNKVECSRNSTKINCASFIEDVDISLPVFDSIVRTNGLAAKIFLSIQENSHFGKLTVTISNDVGATTIDVNVLHSEEMQTIQAEQTTSVTLVLGVVGIIVGVIICIISAVIFVIWKRRSTENTQRNTSLESDKIQSPENERPTEDIEMDPIQGENYDVEPHVYEELGERNEHILEYESLSTGNEGTVSGNVTYENLQIKP